MKSITMILLGNLLYALTVHLFLVPVDLVTGGVTGMSLALGSVTGIPVSQIALVLNALFWIIGLLLLGRKFAATTLLSSAAFPVFLGALEKYVTIQLTDDIFLCTVFAGLGIGISLGLVLREGSSTGGTDVVPLALNRYFHLPIGITMNISDICILAVQILVFPPENLLYGIISVLIYTIVLDRMLMLGTSVTELKIVSNKYEEIRDAILRIADRGVTMLYGEGGYLHHNTQLILSVISNRQLPMIEKLIHTIDPDALIIVSRVTEVSGRGFTLEKEYK